MLVTNIQTQGIENKEKCGSRYSPNDFKLKLNHFSQNHDAHYCSLFEKITISQMFSFITTEEQSYTLSENKTKRVVIFQEETQLQNTNSKSQPGNDITSSIHRTLSNLLAFPLQTLLAGVGLDLRIAR